MHLPAIYLASQSPRRAVLLEQIGVHFDLLLSNSTEDAESLEAILPDEPALAYVQRVTHLKLDAALARRKQRGLSLRPILCADTTVCLHEKIYGKPSNLDEAFVMLKNLSGTIHEVHTAIAIGTEDKIETAVSTSHVQFTLLSDAQIKAYLEQEDVLGKAGAYGIQGHAALFIESLTGSYSGVMGLPLYETGQLLSRFNP